MCNLCQPAELVAIALIRWFEGRLTWSGPVDALWLELQPYLASPVYFQALPVLYHAFTQKGHLLLAASITGGLYPGDRRVDLMRYGVSPGVAAVDAAERLIRKVRANG